MANDMYSTLEATFPSLQHKTSHVSIPLSSTSTSLGSATFPFHCLVVCFNTGQVRGKSGRGVVRQGFMGSVDDIKCDAKAISFRLM